MKMQEDVFRESCCMENVDMEYVAVKDLDSLLRAGNRFKTPASFIRWMISTAPVYISMFGAKEMRISVNCSDLLKQIEELVMIYCEK